MFSLAYVILPFDTVEPAAAIRASLARFERGGRGKVPDDWLEFHDEGEAVRAAHEASFTFVDNGNSGLTVEGDVLETFYMDFGTLKAELRRRGVKRWSVRFCDEMEVNAFFDGFVTRLERDSTGRFGRWLNPCGRWDWWDLGGGFDGHIIGDPSRAAERGVTHVSSGESTGRIILEMSRVASTKPSGRNPRLRWISEATAISNLSRPC